MFVTLDKFGQAIWNASFAVAIAGNVNTADYLLIELGAGKIPLAEETLKDFTQRGLTFLGVIALHEGRSVSAFDHDFDPETVSALSRKFLQLNEHGLNARLANQVGDSLEWLKRLHTLPDIRKGRES